MTAVRRTIDRRAPYNRPPCAVQSPAACGAVTVRGKAMRYVCIDLTLNTNSISRAEKRAQKADIRKKIVYLLCYMVWLGQWMLYTLHLF